MKPRTNPRPKWQARAAAVAMRMIGATLRYRFHDESGLLRQAATGPIIFSVWHNRLALSMEIYHRYARRDRKVEGLVALISASADGAFLADVLAQFDVRAARGSTSRRGPQAFLELSSWAVAGYDLAITPDGPRGPRYALQDGIIGIAQVTALPIVPVSSHLSLKVCLRSWDRFQIPAPGSRAEIFFGAPVRVPREADAEARESYRQQLKERMDAITRD